MDVNPTKEKKLTNIRTHSHDEALRLTPPRPLTLETALEFIAGDELVEVTPLSIRLRKRRSPSTTGVAPRARRTICGEPPNRSRRGTEPRSVERDATDGHVVDRLQLERPLDDRGEVNGLQHRRPLCIRVVVGQQPRPTPDGGVRRIRLLHAGRPAVRRRRCARNSGEGIEAAGTTGRTSDDDHAEREHPEDQGRIHHANSAPDVQRVVLTIVRSRFGANADTVWRMSGPTRRLGARRAMTTMLALFAVALLGTTSVVHAAAPSFAISLSPRTEFTRYDSPTGVTGARDGTNRLFVVERRGTVRAIKDGALQSGWYLDLRSVVEAGNERGLLGLAFDPAFASNRQLYVDYTRKGGDIVIARLTANAARTHVDASTAKTLLVIEHSSASNHNGGALAFGLGGYLYIGVGDGGGGGDPENDAQSTTRNLLGKVLRIDVHGTGAGPYGQYAIPSSNPFRGATRGLDEIWAYGLRNPWRVTVDRGTGRLYIGDVGQGNREEIDREPAGIAGGRNYGWNVMEGTFCYSPSRCPLAGDVTPVGEYTHAGSNCAVTGGYVYRGTAFPALVGQYVFADYCSGRIWTLPQGGLTADMVLRADTTAQITSFGESDAGELYAVSIDGRLFRVEAH